MTKHLFLFLAFFFYSLICLGQSNFTDFIGGWKGELEDGKSLHFTVDINQIESDRYILLISNHKKKLFSRDFSINEHQFQVTIDKRISIHGTLDESISGCTLVAESGLLVYHIPMQETDEGNYRGTWNIWLVDALSPPTVYLSMEEDDTGQLVAYPFFDDHRFTGTWTYDFKRGDKQISFEDFKTSLSFDASLTTNHINLAVKFAGTILTYARLKPYEGSFPKNYSYGVASSTYDIPQKRNDGWPVNTLVSVGIERSPLQQMADSIKANVIINTHSVLIAKDGELVYERYFFGFDASIPYDQRSASKSISSAVIGIAVDQELIKNTDQRLFRFMSEKYAYTRNEDERKSDITLHSLLTMSSGLDAIDFGIDRNSVASEENYQQSSNWLKTVLEAPMIYEPSTHAYYGSANPFLLGVALQSVLNEPIEYFMDKHLLQPLGISEYIIQNDDAGYPYFGGGMYLRPRDMLKFGQLYLNKGTWNGKRIISEKWVEQSFNKYSVLENTQDRSEYGYLWWHHTYEINDKKIASIEARGAGGQYISILPNLDTVIVITSGNFNNGRFWQPEVIIEDYILHAILE